MPDALRDLAVVRRSRFGEVHVLIRRDQDVREVGDAGPRQAMQDGLARIQWIGSNDDVVAPVEGFLHHLASFRQASGKALEPGKIVGVEILEDRHQFVGRQTHRREEIGPEHLLVRSARVCVRDHPLCGVDQVRHNLIGRNQMAELVRESLEIGRQEPLVGVFQQGVVQIEQDGLNHVISNL